jgi:hypothetical protein
MLQLLQRAVSEGYAVPAFCVWNAEMRRAAPGRMLKNPATRQTYGRGSNGGELQIRVKGNVTVL